MDSPRLASGLWKASWEDCRKYRFNYERSLLHSGRLGTSSRTGELRSSLADIWCGELSAKEVAAASVGLRLEHGLEIESTRIIRTLGPIPTPQTL